MRVMIDWDLCIGAGLCLAESPAAFELVETAEGPRAILRAPDDDGRLEAAARRVEADRDEVALPGGPRTVDLLRVGRVALYYRTLDGTEAGWWDAEKGAWRPLSAEHRPALEQALRVARQQSPPGLMWLPVPAPREAGS